MMVLGVDHGNANIKTHTGLKFLSGFTQLNDEGVTTKSLLKYNENYYSIGSQRLSIKFDKTQDEDFFILTLAAIAEEMKKSEEQFVNEPLILSVGLPIVNYGKLKEKFKDYFLRENIEFNYEGIDYRIGIKDCVVFPQSYSALLLKFIDYKSIPVCNVVDIGGGTVDLVKVEEGILNTSSCFSLPIGVINLYNQIMQQGVAGGYRLTEGQIQQMIMGEKPIFEDQGFYRIVKSTTEQFVEKLLSQISEYGFEMRLNPTIFLGGGSILLKEFIEVSKVGYIEVIEDPFANAKGFEMLAKQKLLKR